MNLRLGVAHQFIDVQLNFREHYDLNTHKKQLLISIVDLTKFKRTQAALNESEMRWKFALEGAGDGIWDWRMDNNTLFYSHNWKAMLGYRDRDIGDSFQEWEKRVHPDDFSMWKSALESYISGAIDNYSVQHRLLCADGSYKWILTRGQIIERDANSTALRFIGVHTDISAYKKIEQDLQQAKEQAEVANRAKSAFIANMSHELRTPLNVIMGFAQILLNENFSEQQKNQLNCIHKGGEHLLTIINDILDLAKIEAGRFEIINTCWDAQCFFKDISSMFSIRAQLKGIKFYEEQISVLPFIINSDEKRLRQILLNLISNAIKFTEKGHVTFRYGFQHEALYVEIIDTGIGIKQEHLKSIFNPFEQVSQEKFKYQGTGLGLAITQHLVKAMQGQLQVESTVQQGSVFKLSIPVEVATRKEKYPFFQRQVPQVVGYKRSYGSGALRILIVDDEPNNCLLLKNLLAPLGFLIEEVNDGHTALERAASWQPDLILMDIRMPELDGLEVTQQLRQLPDFKSMPIIAISAAAFAEDKKNSKEAGCQAHLSKPFKIDDLLHILETYLPLVWIPAKSQPAKQPHLTGVALSAAQREKLLSLLKTGNATGLQHYLADLEKREDCPDQVHELLALLNGFRLKDMQELITHNNADL